MGFDRERGNMSVKARILAALAALCTAVGLGVVATAPAQAAAGSYITYVSYVGSGSAPRLQVRQMDGDIVYTTLGRTVYSVNYVCVYPTNSYYVRNNRTGSTARGCMSISYIGNTNITVKQG